MAMYAFLKNRKLRVAFGSGLFVVVIVLAYYLRAIMIPFAISLLLAYMFNPIVNWLEKKKVNRTLGITFLFVAITAVCFLLAATALPALFGQGTELVMAVVGDEYGDTNTNGLFDAGEQQTVDRNGNGIYDQPLLSKFSAWLVGLSGRLSERFGGGETVGHYLQKAFGAIEERMQTTISETQTNLDLYVAAGLKNTFVLFFSLLGFMLIPLYTFFLLKGMERMKQKVVALLPGRSRDNILRIVKKIDLAVSAFFRGRFIVCTICAIITWIGLLIIGVEYAFLFGILIGAATVIPFLGLVFLAPALLVAFTGPGGSVAAVVWTMILYAFVQGLEGSFLTPVILGREVELHPVILILAFLICGKVLGFIGVLLAVPIASIIKILTAEFVMPSIEEMAAERQTAIIPRPAGDTSPSTAAEE